MTIEVIHFKLRKVSSVYGTIHFKLYEGSCGGALRK